MKPIWSYVIIVGICLAIILATVAVIVLCVALTFAPVVASMSHGASNKSDERLADAAFGVLITLIVITYFLKRKLFKQDHLGGAWLMRLSIIFGWLSVVFMLGFAVAAELSSVDSFTRYVLASSPLPGFVFAVLAAVMGVIVCKKEKARSVLWGIIPGLITVILFLALLGTRGGVPAYCISDNGCSILPGGASCDRYITFQAHRADALHPGFCGPTFEPELFRPIMKEMQH
jgi:hypothetical protein